MNISIPILTKKLFNTSKNMGKKNPGMQYQRNITCSYRKVLIRKVIRESMIKVSMFLKQLGKEKFVLPKLSLRFMNLKKRMTFINRYRR